MSFEIDKWLENFKEEERIRCPYCNHDVSNNGDYYAIYEAGLKISYHGWPDEEVQTVECENCMESFKVREHVRRTFDTCKMDGDFE